MNSKSFRIKTIFFLCLTLLIGVIDSNAFLYDIFYEMNGTALNPAPVSVLPPGNYSYTAAANVSGTYWNQVSRNTLINDTSLAIGIYPYSANNQAASGLIVDGADNRLSGVALAITYTNSSTGGNRTEPSSNGGENSIQPGGVMGYSWRAYYGGGNGFYYNFSGLPASTPFDLYVYTGCGNGGGLSLSLLPQYALGSNTTNALLFNGPNSAGTYGSIWTGTSPNYTILPIGATWTVLHGMTDGSGTFSFKYTGGGFSSGSSSASGSYFSGFQLIQIPLSSYSVTGGGTSCTSVTVGLSGSQTGVSYQLMNGSTAVGSPVAGTGSAISFSGQAASGTYTVVGTMTDGTSRGGSATMTGNAVVTINPPTTVGAALPASQLTSVGATINITVTSSGTAPLTYVWQKNGVTLTNGLQASGSMISGAATNNLQIADVQLGDATTAGGGYTCTVYGSCGDPVTSAQAMLSVSTGPTPPILTSLTNQTVVAGNNATLSAIVASGYPTPGLQWYLSTDGGATFNGIDGATSASLALPDVQYFQTGYEYSLEATNDAGTNVASMTLTVDVPVTISTQPTNLMVLSGSSAGFSVAATGVPTPAYQWYFGTNRIANATSANYTITNAAPSNIGSYSVVVSNSVNSVTSSVVTLKVNSTTLSVTSFTPSNGAVNICYDTPLYITFNETPVLKGAGKINVYNITNTNTPVETIDLTLNATNGTQARVLFPGDSTPFNFYPVVITGTAAAIYPLSSSSTLTSNQTYYVTVDDGVFADTTGAYFAGITTENTWQFTTKVAGPVDPVNPVVNINGSGDFATVQGAVNSLALNANGAHRSIRIMNGTYFELVDIAGVTNVTLLGQNRYATLIEYPNNVNIGADGGAVAGRCSFKINANDVSLNNLTITNSTPQGGGQAEAFNTAGSRTIVNNCTISSRQDTLLPGDVYFYNSEIYGNFDYIWGGGTLYFYKCVFHTLSGAQNLTAARTATSSSLSASTPWINPNGTTYSANGFSFVDCSFVVDPGLSGVTLGDANGSSGGLDSWAFCQFDTNGYITPSVTLSNSYVYWQYQNTDTNGHPTSFANLQTIGVTNNDPRLLAATNVPAWLGGWTPKLLPDITTNPVAQTVSQGQTANFVVSATGVPDPGYQWLSNNVPIPNANNSTLSITNAVRTDAANYSVIVTNSSGSVTSSVATLTYTGDVGPVAGPTFTLGVVLGVPSTVQIVGGKYSPTEADGDTLTISNPNATNGTVTTDGTNLTYTATNGTTDTIVYTINDGYGKTAVGIVIVAIAPAAGNNQLSAQTADGLEVLNFLGVPTDDYALEWTHNLTPPVNWTPLLTNQAANNGTLAFTNTLSGAGTDDFYRIQLVQ